MLLSTTKLFVPLVYLSLLIASASLVQAHDFSLHQRDHANINMKRLMKKRSPFPQGDPIGPIPIGAAPIPVSSSSVSESSSSSATQTATSTLTSTSESVAGSTSSSVSSSTSSTSTSSSSSTSTSSGAAQTSQTLNLSSNPDNVATSTVIAPTVTRTASVQQPSDTALPSIQSNSSKNKSTTLTVLIVVAASVGGVAILWTIFRKWKLSSSKKFDRRLNPITDWQPTNGEDDIVPSHRRAPSNASSFRSGSGHGHGSARGGHGSDRGLAPLEHDFTPGPANSVGGYADLARGPSPNPPMQEALTRGPSVNRGYNLGVPLHHQAGYGSHDAYDYSGGNVRY